MSPTKHCARRLTPEGNCQSIVRLSCKECRGIEQFRIQQAQVIGTKVWFPTSVKLRTLSTACSGISATVLYR